MKMVECHKSLPWLDRLSATAFAQLHAGLTSLCPLSAALFTR